VIHHAVTPSIDGSSGLGGTFTTHSNLKSSQQLSVPEKRNLSDGWFATFIQQSSAVAVVALLNLMMAIPFGASYFPIGWKANDSEGGDEDDETDISGAFPLPGKQALGTCNSWLWRPTIVSTSSSIPHSLRL
jgi:hypothetical protein